MALLDFVVSTDAAQHLPSRWISFLVGTVCGGGITLIAALYRNSKMAKTLTIERNDMLTPTISRCTNTLEESIKVSSETTSEERASKGDGELAPPGDEKTGHLVQTSSQTPAESDVQAPSVQLDDLHDLEDYLYLRKADYIPGPNYLYLPKPEGPQNNEKESDLPRDRCWCITTWGSKLEPLLQTVHRHFNNLEDIRCSRWYFDRDLVVADQEIRAIGDSLNEVAFRYAIRQGYTEFVSRYIRYPRSIGWDSLKLAITYDQIDIARVLLAKARLSDHLKHCGLEEAAHQGRLKLMNLFMFDFGIDMNGCDETNPLKAAAAAGQVDAVKQLIKVGVGLEARGKKSMVESPNHTPLIAAVARDQFEVVKELICAGALIEGEPWPETVPLNVAIKEGHARIVDLLLEHGASPHWVGSAYGWKDILRLAVKKGHIELAKRALNRHANVNMAVDTFGTLLKQAVIQQDEQMVRLLINRGANINHHGDEYDWGGNCALLASASSRDRNVFLLLLRHGALMEKANGYFGNLMQTVAYLGYADMVQVVLEKKPDIDVDYTGNSKISLTPLDLALSYYVRARDGVFRTAKGMDHLEVMRLLLNHGARWPEDEYQDLRRQIEGSGIQGRGERDREWDERG